jgi:sensor domain CHASE-containing protein
MKLRQLSENKQTDQIEQILDDVERGYYRNVNEMLGKVDDELINMLKSGTGDFHKLEQLSDKSGQLREKYNRANRYQNQQNQQNRFGDNKKHPIRRAISSMWDKLHDAGQRTT